MIHSRQVSIRDCSLNVGRMPGTYAQDIRWRIELRITFNSDDPESWGIVVPYAATWEQVDNDQSQTVEPPPADGPKWCSSLPAPSTRKKFNLHPHPAFIAYARASRELRERVEVPGLTFHDYSDLALHDLHPDDSHVVVYDGPGVYAFPQLTAVNGTLYAYALGRQVDYRFEAAYEVIDPITGEQVDLLRVAVRTYGPAGGFEYVVLPETMYPVGSKGKRVARKPVTSG